MKKTLILVTVLCLQISISTALAASVAYGLGKDRAPQNFNILGENLTGQSPEQALANIEKRFPQGVSYQGQVFPLHLDQTKAKWRRWLDSQYSPTGGSWFADAFKYLARGAGPTSPSPELLDKNEVLTQLNRVKAKLDRSPRVAQIVFKNRQLIRTKGEKGLSVDVRGTWQELLTKSPGEIEPLQVKTLLPQPDDAQLEEVKDVLGDYTTYFDPDDRNRTNNVRLAAKALDGKLIPPGAVFSFNNSVGARTESIGYLPAYIFVNKDIVKADGGGVCQDSSTLYQAVKQANLLLLERHMHSLPVVYVAKGQDATVAYGLLDFRFKNDTKGYLLLSAQTGSHSLRIRIFGQGDSLHPPIQTPGAYPAHLGQWDHESK